MNTHLRERWDVYTNGGTEPNPTITDGCGILLRLMRGCAARNSALSNCLLPCRRLARCRSSIYTAPAAALSSKKLPRLAPTYTRRRARPRRYKIGIGKIETLFFSTSFSTRIKRPREDFGGCALSRQNGARIVS